MSYGTSYGTLIILSRSYHRCALFHLSRSSARFICSAQFPFEFFRIFQLTPIICWLFVISYRFRCSIKNADGSHLNWLSKNSPKSVNLSRNTTSKLSDKTKRIRNSIFIRANYRVYYFSIFSIWKIFFIILCQNWTKILCETSDFGKSWK